MRRSLRRTSKRSTLGKMSGGRSLPRTHNPRNPRKDRKQDGMWEYRLEFIQPGQTLPRYCQLFTPSDEGKHQAEGWLLHNCLREGGAFTGKPEEFKRGTDRGYPTPKADRQFWAIFYQEFRENDFGLEIP